MVQAASAGRLGRVLRQLAAIAAIAFAGAMVAPGAFAHDQLIGSDPVNGSTVKTAPNAIVLMYSAELKNIGTSVVLQDAQGKKYDAVAAASGANLTVGVRDALGAGNYTLEWRVVSSDGHPIEGTTANGQAITFSVSGGAASSSAASSAASETGTAGTSASSSAPASSASASSAASNPVQEAAQNSGVSPWLIGIVAGLAVIAAVATLIAKNRKRN
ncbi:copper resistance CopC family protein [Neomicrococcus lactis]|uniref:CopC domain-containing protein n=1 Tax=Neomicrococcus lactis TaxID=732241 RepID=A0A7W8YDI4_9MICC|nr:copper resistance CopC family protein [Neomicrococcus lactis]MBB5599245.1 hypothetical protein [Neomicrococcus lactis]